MRCDLPDPGRRRRGTACRCRRARRLLERLLARWGCSLPAPAAAAQRGRMDRSRSTGAHMIILCVSPAGEDDRRWLVAHGALRYQLPQASAEVWLVHGNGCSARCWARGSSSSEWYWLVLEERCTANRCRGLWRSGLFCLCGVLAGAQH